MYDHDTSDVSTATSALDDNAVDFPSLNKPTAEHTINGGFFKVIISIEVFFITLMKFLTPHV